MNYVLYNSNKIPNYLKDCISNIKKVDSNSSIYLISDEKTHYDGVISIISSEIISSQTREIIDLDVYRGTNYEKDPLWITSLIRLFFLRDLVGNYQLKDIIHFDNDVLVYVNTDKISNLFIKDKVNITRVNEAQLVFGYSYFDTFEVLNNLCVELYETLIKEVNTSGWKDNPKNEMRLLASVYINKPELFNILKSYPEGGTEYIFDPAVYGQIIGGTHTRPRRFIPQRFYKSGTYSKDTRKKYLPRGGWLDEIHEVTKKILAEKPKLVFKKNKPILKKKSRTYQLVNLHIHSKELNKYKL
jgi:hypothetical protein